MGFVTTSSFDAYHANSGAYGKDDHSGTVTSLRETDSERKANVLDGTGKTTRDLTGRIKVLPVEETEEGRDKNKFIRCLKFFFYCRRH
jgi:hypothetical protein